MTAVQPFIFDETLVVRTLMRDGDPWFVARDVAAALGYEKPQNAVQTHCKGALNQGILSPGGEQETKIIPESDVYRLIMRSNLPSAERFQDWVCEEVLPTIRKTGGYFLAQGAEAAFLLQETEREMGELKARRHALNLEIRRLEKRRLRLGGERLVIAGPVARYSDDDILDEIPPEGIRTMALFRRVRDKCGMCHQTFMRNWRKIRAAGLVTKLPDGQMTKA